MGSIVLSWYYNDAKRPCSVISNVQYKSFISLLTHFSQQSLHIISIRCYLLISPLTIDWNQTQSLLSLPFFMHLSLSLSLFSSDFSITFNSISNMHSVYLKHLLPQRFFLFLFCSSLIIGYAPIHDEVSTLLFQLFQTAKWRVHWGLLYVRVCIKFRNEPITKLINN